MRVATFFLVLVLFSCKPKQVSQTLDTSPAEKTILKEIGFIADAFDVLHSSCKRGLSEYEMEKAFGYLADEVARNTKATDITTWVSYKLAHEKLIKYLIEERVANRKLATALEMAKKSKDYSHVSAQIEEKFEKTQCFLDAHPEWVNKNDRSKEAFSATAASYISAFSIAGVGFGTLLDSIQGPALISGIKSLFKNYSMQSAVNSVSNMKIMLSTLAETQGTEAAVSIGYKAAFRNFASDAAIASGRVMVAVAKKAFLGLAVATTAYDLTRLICWATGVNTHVESAFYKNFFAPSTQEQDRIDATAQATKLLSKSVLQMREIME